MLSSRQLLRKGSRKAAVLPVPVWAWPITSRPVEGFGDEGGLNRGGFAIADSVESCQQFGAKGERRGSRCAAPPALRSSNKPSHTNGSGQTYIVASILLLSSLNPSRLPVQGTFGNLFRGGGQDRLCHPKWSALQRQENFAPSFGASPRRDRAWPLLNSLPKNSRISVIGSPLGQNRGPTGAFGYSGPGLDADLATLERVARRRRRADRGHARRPARTTGPCLPRGGPLPRLARPCPIQHEPRTLATAHSGTLCYREPAAHCPACRRDFFPCASGPGLDGPSYTPALLERIVTLAGLPWLFEQVAVALEIGADVQLTGRRVQRLTQEGGPTWPGVGTSRRIATAAATCRRRRRRRQRWSKWTAAVWARARPGRGRGCISPRPRRTRSLAWSAWRGCPGLRPATGACWRCFATPAGGLRLVRQFQGQAAAGRRGGGAGGRSADRGRQRPTGEARAVGADLRGQHEQQPGVRADGGGGGAVRGFFDASRQAFLGDGQKYNWRIHRAYFPPFEAVADFLHVLCYLYRGAGAVGGDEAARWRQFETGMRACWQGWVEEVLSELAAWQERLGRPPPEADDQDLRRVVTDVRRYLWNNRERMDYPRYRRAGLPVTSSWVESLVGEFNGRVKGWDKYGNRSAGAEAILQVRAALRGAAGQSVPPPPARPMRKGSEGRKQCRAWPPLSHPISALSCAASLPL